LSLRSVEELAGSSEHELLVLPKKGTTVLTEAGPFETE
jgi:hypothetical protein